jgi:hypothetical protein
MSEPTRPLVVIGWKEYADLPDWNLFHVPVKIDTGARTTALGVTAWEQRRLRGQAHVRLTLAPWRGQPQRVRTVTVPLLRVVRVKNTGGSITIRPVIELTLQLGPVRKLIAATVADRSHMLTPIIVGRSALAGDFLVDAARKYVLKRSNG